jgi:chemotaxis protein CheD
VDIVVGVADMKTSNHPGDCLVTYSLGPCIAVAAYDPVVVAGGLLHFMLPNSGLDPDKAQRKPHMFADTGIPHLFRSLYKLGAKKNRMKVIITGGSKINDKENVFNIGKRNYIAVRKIFWKNNVVMNYQHVGGDHNRTLKMAIRNGKVWLRVSGEGVLEI